MSCRDEILDCAREVINQKGRNEFTIKDILGCMRRHGTKYSDSTIRTHIVSRLCANAPDHHAVTYPDLERTDRGAYRLRGIPLPPKASHRPATINREPREARRPNARLRGSHRPGKNDAI